MTVQPGDPDPEELRDEQERRAREERRLADEAAEPADERAHDRRADKAEYLREKLTEQARTRDE